MSQQPDSPNLANADLNSIDLDRIDLDAAVQTARTGYVVRHRESGAAHDRARVVMPGGNTRSVLHFDPYPFRVASASDATLVDVDGHHYVDFCGNYTAGLLGHSPALIRDAVVEALDQGWAVGATHGREIELAELVCQRFASIEQVRFTNSGTEANLMAIGTALHHTSRSGVGVFDHGYHGGVLGFGALDSPSHSPLNVPHRFIVSAFDDIGGLDALFADGDLGCVVVEPVQGSGGCRPASLEFLQELRRRCDESGTVLIFDEVMTSRLSPGGAQQLFGVSPDMTTLGKYLGGGMTFGAFGGRHHLMSHFDPAADGVLTQAGTFNNNVVSMAAAIATLRNGLDPQILEAVNDRGDRLRLALGQVFNDAGLPLWVTGVGSMLCVRSDDDRWVELFFHAMLSDSHYLARRGFMALSMAVTDDHVDALISSAEQWAAHVMATQ
ncbi:MAG: aspartate aminotransferase family protein [Acidimicrobiales bacterium]